jgi:hypothetical protein
LAALLDGKLLFICHMQGLNAVRTHQSWLNRSPGSDPDGIAGCLRHYHSCGRHPLIWGIPLCFAGRFFSIAPFTDALDFPPALNFNNEKPLDSSPSNYGNV